METNESVGSVEAGATKVWTTGDPEKDWARYQGQFDRIDKGVGHWLACLFVFDGFLIIAMAGQRSGNYVFNVPFELLVMWLGFVVSLVVYWSQYRALCHRRFLYEQWASIYPEVQPTPSGYESFEKGSPAVAPSALIPLLSAVLWFVMTGITLGWELAPEDSASQSGFLGAVRVGMLIATAVALVAFYLEFVMYYPSRFPDKEPATPRKW